MFRVLDPCLRRIVTKNWELSPFPVLAEVVHVIAAAPFPVAFQIRLLGLVATILEIVVEVQPFRHLHRVDNSSGDILGSGAQNPVSLLKANTHMIGSADGECAAAVEWIWCEPRIVLHDIRA